MSFGQVINTGACRCRVAVGAIQILHVTKTVSWEESRQEILRCGDQCSYSFVMVFESWVRVQQWSCMESQRWSCSWKVAPVVLPWILLCEVKGGVASPVTCVTNLKSDAKHCNLHVLCDFCMEQSLLGTCGKLRKCQCFCSVLSKKHIVNTVVLGFRGATNIGVFCSESFKKTQTHKLFDNFRPLRDWEKNCMG